MKTLGLLVEREAFEIPAFALDHFQKKVREGLHLEFFLARGRLILTPHLAPLTTAEATAAEKERVRAICEESQDVLEQKRKARPSILMYSRSPIFPSSDTVIAK